MHARAPPQSSGVSYLPGCFFIFGGGSRAKAEAQTLRRHRATGRPRSPTAASNTSYAQGLNPALARRRRFFYVYVILIVCRHTRDTRHETRAHTVTHAHRIHLSPRVLTVYLYIYTYYIYNINELFNTKTKRNTMHNQCIYMLYARVGMYMVHT